MKDLRSQSVKVHFKSRWGIIINKVYLHGKIKRGSFTGTSRSGRLYYKRPLIVEFQPYVCTEHDIKVHSYKLIDNKTGQCCEVNLSPKIYHLGRGETVTVTLPLNKIRGFVQGYLMYMDRKNGLARYFYDAAEYKK